MVSRTSEGQKGAVATAGNRVISAVTNGGILLCYIMTAKFECGDRKNAITIYTMPALSRGFLGLGFRRELPQRRQHRIAEAVAVEQSVMAGVFQ